MRTKATIKTTSVRTYQVLELSRLMVRSLKTEGSTLGSFAVSFTTAFSASASASASALASAGGASSVDGNGEVVNAPRKTAEPTSTERTSSSLKLAREVKAAT